MSTAVPYLDVRRVGDACVIEFSRPDVTDQAYIKQAGEEIDRVIQKLEPPRLVIDFTRVQRLSSATLGMLVALKETVEQKEGELCLANVEEKVYDIFRLTKLHKVLKICDTLDEAVEKVSS